MSMKLKVRVTLNKIIDSLFVLSMNKKSYQTWSHTMSPSVISPVIIPFIYQFWSYTMSLSLMSPGPIPCPVH